MRDRQKTFLIRTCGGIGDALLATPTFRALKERYEGCTVKVICDGDGQREALKNNPYIDCLVTLQKSRYYRFLMKYRPNKFIYTDYGNLQPAKFFNYHSTEIIAAMVGIKIASRDLEIYLTDDEEAKAKKYLSQFTKPIIMQIASITSKNQNWEKEKWEELIARMPECTFIHVGAPWEDELKGAVDLRARTSLREALSLLKFCSGFVGVVSGFSHATNAFKTPGVVLFGPSSPLIWGHPNNINIFKGLHCSPCVDILMNESCIYNKECISDISVDQVERALRRQTENKPVCEKILI